MKKNPVFILFVSAVLLVAEAFLFTPTAHAHIFSELKEEIKSAAVQGDAEAQNALGFMYMNGYGTEQDDAEAVKWFRMAAEEGYADAQTRLGMMYVRSRVVQQEFEQNYRDAAYWYRKAADQGHRDAQMYLGDLYVTGYGVERNFWMATEWHRKAIPLPLMLLNTRFWNDLDLDETKDDTRAFNWSGKSAAKGSAVAQAFLGAMYAEGIGVKKEDEKAYFWLMIAAAQNENYAKARDIAAQKLSPEILGATQERARKWVDERRTKAAEDSSPDGSE